MTIKTTKSLSIALQKRFQELLLLTQELPPVGCRPLTVCGRVCGWAHDAAANVLSRLPGVAVDGEAVHIASNQSPSAKVNARLAEIAVALDAAGCVKSWRNELLDVVGEGQHLGAIERGGVRPLGLLTQAVHLNAWTPDGHLWVQKRASHKSTDPDKWDTLVGGLSSANEDLHVSLIRECEEEAGLFIDQLHALEPMRLILRMHRRLPEGYQVENVWVNDCVLDETTTPKNLDGEVSEIRSISIDEYWEMAQLGMFTLEAEIVILDSIRRRIENSNGG
ncbi:DUF4743 domain-containing protein [Paenalcaligenes niemegkensis]|uniref:NUDIX hydrolase n=1 Tax=Paenalcaligenes niemegkensis TaxID=2895469 RepID=UPI001EE84FF6|nr:DUF4743 domain-containing protein [Paenalcaligenes niemegkensis]MCQ9617718.1 DUF4743 domain-containing protein [Paenalcaligenes niemegkensis]